MRVRDFKAFFRMATGRDPFPYQTSLAEGQAFPELIRVPTGAGKTAAAARARRAKRVA
jgi:CRISPR-associated endonuclease/helicase Cas3